MRTRKAAPQNRSALTLVEETVHLLRVAPVSLLVAYFVGTIPFILGLLYFIADMDRGVMAAEQCGEGAFVLTLLFFWMKCWQTVYGAGIHAVLREETIPPWTVRRAGRMILDQVVVQSTAVVVFPIALLFVFPLHWVYAAYQNFTVLARGADDESQGSLVRRAVAQAMLWQRQNITLIWLMSPWMLLISVSAILFSVSFISEYGAIFFLPLIPISLAISPVGIVVSVNMALLICLSPALLHMLLGIQTTFSLSGASAYLNSTFLATVLSLAYLCMDPVIKAAYAARCLQGESLVTGDDLRAALRRFANRGRGLVLLAIVAVTLAVGSSARGADASAPSGIAPRELDSSISRVLTERQYAWRQPHVKPVEAAAGKESWLNAFLMSGWKILVRFWHWSLKLAKQIAEWLWDHLPKRSHSSEEGGGWSLSGINTLLYVILFVSVSALVLALFMYVWRARRRVREVDAEDVSTTPDIEDDGVTADRLPCDEWMNLAQSLIQQGDLRLALRALFLANLAWLSQRELIRIARFKSNHDYVRELASKEHVYPELPGKFSAGVRIFERVWYGRTPVDAELLNVFTANDESMRACAQ